MKIIDTHTHVFPDKLAARATAQLSKPGIYFPHYDGTLDGLLASMEKYGIDQSWTVPVSTSARQVDTINAYATTQPREHIVPFGAIHPDTEDPREVLSHFKELGLVGYKMHPDYQNVRPTDPRMDAIWEATVEFGLIGYFHAGDDENPHTKLGEPKEFAQVLDRYPTIKLCLAHFGGFNMWDDVEKYLIGRDVWLDTAYTFGHIDNDQFLRMARRHGFERITFGTDGPWTDPADSLNIIKSLGLSDSELENLMHGAAEGLLALP